MSEVNSDQKALLQKAILEIRDLKARLKSATEATAEPIAIIGASCRFPGGANSLDDYWQLLLEGRDGISKVPEERWDAEAYYDPDPDAPGKICTPLGGFLSQSAYGFDASFFGISPREAESLDPQQRLLMELSWEAIEHANILPEALFKTNTGVFMGLSSLDNATRIIGEAPLRDIDGYYGTGIALAPAAGRISYHFGFTGPSYVVDTACSSSLLSLHLASESIRRGECTMALAGGIQLLMHPGVSVAFTKARMLSPDGCCKTFDEQANGYVRGEGGGIVVLKKMSDAIRDGDRILALIRGSAVNQDGASGGLTVPSGPSQESVIRKALHQAGLKPDDISYIEAHGTGTPLGDPIEIGALHAVFGQNHSKEQPLKVGSVKTNIGHLEAGAGIASAIKVMLSLVHKKIAPSLHFTSPNKLIPWSEIPIQVPVELADWNHGVSGKPRSAGISSFGFSGTNVHLIMQEAPDQTDQQPLIGTTSDSHQLLVISAKTTSSLRQLAQTYASYLDRLSNHEWPAFAYSAATMRTAFKHRLAISTDCPIKASSILKAWLTDAENSSIVEGTTHEGQIPKVLMLFSGQGSQYLGMGKALYETSKEFRDYLDECNKVMEPIMGHSIQAVLFDGDHDLNQTQYTQPALFALQVALARTWKAYGGTIDGVMGHSVGEYAAAVVAGVLSLEDAAKLIIHRGLLMQQLPQDGGMIAIFTSSDRIRAILVSFSDHRLSVAAVNGWEHVVVSGYTKDIIQLKTILDQQKLDYRDLNVSHAFHSSLMEPMMDEFYRIASQVRFNAAYIPFYNNLTGSIDAESLKTPEHWVKQIREPVLFKEALINALKDGFTFLIEAGPKSTLIQLARSIMGQIPGDQLATQDLGWASMLSPKQPDKAHFLNALGSFWSRGGEIHWKSLMTKGKADLPLYEFDRSLFRKNVQIDAGLNSHMNAYESPKVMPHRLMQRITDSPLISSTLFVSEYKAKDHSIFMDHRVFGQYVVAGAAHLSLTIAAAQKFVDQEAVELQEVVFPQALVLPEDESRSIHLSIQKETDGPYPFKLISGDETFESTKTHAIGKLQALKTEPLKSEWNAFEKRCPKTVETSIVYETQKKRFIEVGDSYRWLQTLNIGDGLAIAHLAAPPDAYESGYGLHPGLIDSCFGLLALTAELDIDETFIPFGVASLKVFRMPKGGVLRAIAQRKQLDVSGGKMIGDIRIESEEGELLILFEGMEGRKASASALIPESSTDLNKMIFETKWTNPSEMVSGRKYDHIVLVVPEGCDVKSIPEALAAHDVVYFKKGSDFRSETASATILDPYDSPQLERFWSSRTVQPELILVAGNLKSAQPTPSLDKVLDDQTDLITATLDSLTLLVQSMKTRGLNIPIVPLSVVSTSKHDTPVITASASAVHAFIRSVRKEIEAFSGAEIYLNDDVQGSEWMNSLDQWNTDKESVWIRTDGMRYARLSINQTLQAAKPSFSADGVYLITGGSGSLAQHLVGFLTDHGAREYIIISRSANAELAESIRLSVNTEIRLHLLQVDISDKEHLQNSLKQVKEPLHRLKGVFHLAGLSEDRSVDTLTGRELRNAIEPKYQGLIHLVDGLNLEKIDHFVIYSSLASVLGNAGQAAYSAANAAMDAFADQLSLLGLPLVTIQWGPWHKLGMMSRLNDAAQRYLQTQGIGSIRAEQASQVLRALLSSGARGSFTVAKVDWDSGYHHTGVSRDLRRVKDSSPSSSSFLETLTKAPERQRTRMVMELLNGMLTKALRMSPEYQIDRLERLFDLGVDSLIAIELKNNLQSVLQRPVSSTLLFDYPNLDTLTKHILEDLLSHLHQPLTEGASFEEPDLTPVHTAGDINELSEEAAEEELLRALQQIQGFKPS